MSVPVLISQQRDVPPSRNISRLHVIHESGIAEKHGPQPPVVGDTSSAHHWIFRTLGTVSTVAQQRRFEYTRSGSGDRTTLLHHFREECSKMASTQTSRYPLRNRLRGKVDGSTKMSTQLKGLRSNVRDTIKRNVTDKRSKGRGGRGPTKIPEGEGRGRVKSPQSESRIPTRGDNQREERGSKKYPFQQEITPKSHTSLCPMGKTPDSNNDIDIDLSGSPIFDIKMDCDTFSPQPRYIVVFNDTENEKKTLVTVDSTKLKSFCWWKGEHFSSWVELNSYVWGMTKFTVTKVAIAAPNVKEIQIFKVDPDLIVDNTFTTRKGYCGIGALKPDALVVSSKSPPCVDIIDLSGRILKSFTTVPSLGRSFETPGNLHVTKDGNILVADSQIKQVICMTPDGAIVFAYRNKAFESAGRIISTDSGGVLFVEGRSSGKIVHLNNMGQYVRDIKWDKTDKDYEQVCDVCMEDGLVYFAIRWKGVTALNLPQCL